MFDLPDDAEMEALGEIGDEFRARYGAKFDKDAIIRGLYGVAISDDLMGLDEPDRLEVVSNAYEDVLSECMMAYAEARLKGDSEADAFEAAVEPMEDITKLLDSGEGIAGHRIDGLIDEYVAAHMALNGVDFSEDGDLL